MNTWVRRLAAIAAGGKPPIGAVASDGRPTGFSPTQEPSAALPSIGDILPPVPVAPDGSNAYSRRERFIVTELIYSRLLPKDTFSILDGGARGGPSDPRWRSIGDERLVIHGFEVDDAECQRLNRDAAERGLRHHYYPWALWSSKGPSAFRQNVVLTNRWKFQNAKQKFYAREIFFPTGETIVASTTIDDWARKAGITEIDFFKLNVQGAELEILEGARDALATVLGIEVEVSFTESYLGRPFFSDIDALLRRNGFHFFDLLGLHNMGRAESPITSMHTPGLNPYQGQLIEAHGLYFRDPIASDAGLNGNFPFTRLLKLASIAEIYGQVEYTFELLGWLSRRLTEAGHAEDGRRIFDLRETAFRLHQRYLWAPSP
jgi:FkbM family methyltransferase